MGRNFSRYLQELRWLIYKSAAVVDPDAIPRGVAFFFAKISFIAEYCLILPSLIHK
jgi:hypothetical protein